MNFTTPRLRPSRRGLLIVATCSFTLTAILLGALFYPEIAMSAILLLGIMTAILGVLAVVVVLGASIWEFVCDVKEQRERRGK